PPSRRRSLRSVPTRRPSELDPLPDLRLGVAALLDEPHRQVLGDRHRVEERRELEDVPHPAPQLVQLVARQRRHLLLVHHHPPGVDRKSTRLNSSHVTTSYAG